MGHPKDIQIKAEAIVFVSAELRTAPSLFSPGFQIAMDLSRRFDISVLDVLQYRKELAKRCG